MDNYSYEIKQIAHIENDFRDKFGVPRQSGLAPSVMSKIVFEPEFRNVDTLRGLEDFSHIWLIWQFSKNLRDDWSPTVRPPKLGGNERVGVFASRSPFRPNALGLSSVKIEGVTVEEKNGPVIKVSGADLLNGTPIFDIKPYIPFTDIHTDAKGGFTDTTAGKVFEVVIPERIRRLHDREYLQELTEVLRGDPRPGCGRLEGSCFRRRENSHRDRVFGVCQQDGYADQLGAKGISGRAGRSTSLWLRG